MHICPIDTAPGSPGCLLNLITTYLSQVTVGDHRALFKESGVDVSFTLVSQKHLVYHRITLTRYFLQINNGKIGLIQLNDEGDHL